MLVRNNAMAVLRVRAPTHKVHAALCLNIKTGRITYSFTILPYISAHTCCYQSDCIHKAHLGTLWVSERPIYLLTTMATFFFWKGGGGRSICLVPGSYLFGCVFVCLFVRLFVCSFVCLFVCLFVCVCVFVVRVFVCLCVLFCLFVCLLFVCLFVVCLSICLFCTFGWLVCLFVCLFCFFQFDKEFFISSKQLLSTY